MYCQRFLSGFLALSLCHNHIISLIVDTVKQAIQLCTTVYKMMRTGEARSVAQALLKLNRSKKTLDRFRHIYYLHHLDKDELKTVSCSSAPDVVSVWHDVMSLLRPF